MVIKTFICLYRVVLRPLYIHHHYMMEFLTLSSYLSLSPIQTVSSVHTGLMYVSLSWSANVGASMHRNPFENVAHQFVHTFTTISCLSCYIWMGCNSPYSCCFVECCFQDVFKTVRFILYGFRVRPRWCIHIVVLTKRKLERNAFLSYQRSDFHIIVNLSKTDHAFDWRILSMFYLIVFIW